MDKKVLNLQSNIEELIHCIIFADSKHKIFNIIAIKGFKT